MANLYIDRKGIDIRADGEALAFYEQGERIGTVPMAPLSRVYLRGDVTFKASLLGKLGERGIGVIILSGRQGKASLLMARPHQDARLRLQQYRAAHSTDTCFDVAHWLVKAKLENQRELLRDALAKRSVYRYEITLQLRQLAELLNHKLPLARKIDSLRGLEGAGARAFFQALRCILPDEIEFNGRNRRPPKDPANALLSLGFTMLHNEAVLALQGAGLDPYIGFYHQLLHGRESLACDVIEPLRPLMTTFVIKLFTKQTLRRHHFTQSGKGCMLGKSGRQHFYQAYNQFHEELLGAINQQINTLRSLLADTPYPPQELHHDRLSDLL